MKLNKTRRNKKRVSKTLRVKRGGAADCENPVWKKGRGCPNHHIIPAPEIGPGYYKCLSCPCLSKGLRR